MSSITEDCCFGQTPDFLKYTFNCHLGSILEYYLKESKSYKKSSCTSNCTSHNTYCCNMWCVKYVAYEFVCFTKKNMVKIVVPFYNSITLILKGFDKCFLAALSSSWSLVVRLLVGWSVGPSVRPPLWKVTFRVSSKWVSEWVSE